jgi:hypothetical protein
VIDLIRMNNAIGVYTTVSTVLLTESEAGRRKQSKYKYLPYQPAAFVVVVCFTMSADKDGGKELQGRALLSVWSE